MNKFIHVDSENGDLYVSARLIRNWYGWAYEVPSNFVLTVPLKQLHRAKDSIDELLSKQFRPIKLK